MPRPLPSLAALTILDAGPAGQIRAAAEAGFKSVGLRLMPLLPTDQRVVGDTATEAEVVRLLADARMDVLEIGVFPIKPQMDWPAIERVLAFSARIGARMIVCPVEDPDEPRRVATYARLCDAAAQHGLEALVEFNPYSTCRNLRDADTLVDAVARLNAGHVIDALHLSRSGGSPADLAGIDPARLALVHLCDAPPPPAGTRTVDDLRAESRTARLLPGEGALWLDDLLDALPARTGLSIEAPSALHAQLPAAERARRALEATTALLARHHLR